MKLDRLLRRRRHPAAEFVSDHGLLLAGIAGSAALAFAANRMRGKQRPQIVDRAVGKTRDLRDRARGLMSRDRHDHANDGGSSAEQPSIAHANSSRNRVELSAR
ncbi:MAG TPA: hypothetical protein VFS08_05980 [Gemmatimonadaceae bacterium]|nr:hypothetical protein [Gemmatimonadaceae bacterium]